MISVLLAAAIGAMVAGADLRGDGAFGFPQKEARVLCDTPELRVSAFSDAEYLFVQAVLWTDGDNTDGETDDGRAIGDWSSLMIDADADGKATGQLDRNYALNPWPASPGLHYSVVFDDRGTSGLTADSKGHGAVSYVTEADGKRVRVDSYLIPLSELKRKPGESVRFAYWGSSPHPDLTVNSVGFVSQKRYYSHSLPRKDWHEFALADRPAVLDITKVPEGRGTIKIEKANKPMPETGSAPPEVKAAGWLNWGADQPPTLAGLKGHVVVVEFWATWCGPCVEGIPHLNELHDKHFKDGLVILSLTDQKKEHVEEFMKKTPMRYTVGVKSQTAGDYGVSGIPHAFIVGKDGKLLWHGHPQEGEFAETLKKALAAK